MSTDPDDVGVVAACSKDARSEAILHQQILKLLGSRTSAPTTATVLDYFSRASGPNVGEYEVKQALGELVREGRVRCFNGLWVRTDRLLVDNRTPSGPRRIDPKSAEARTLPLEFYK